MTSNTYRPEIDGLRAVAVLGVVLFHLGVAPFGGGFTGVDVFFVISGYLISRNILNDVEAGRFSYVDFYARRARRILPALIFTVAVTFIAGLLWLSPVGMRQLAKESTHALLSISNIQYWRESKEYFASASDQLALLHCWSLSLEEQFYLFWPLFLLLALRTKKVVLATCCIGLLSFAFAAWWAAHSPQATFFLMPFRVFEFAIGASINFTDRSRLRNTAISQGLTVLGLLCVVAGFAFCTPTSPFWIATLVPSVGSAAIILANHDGGPNRFLTNRAALTIGRSSYSLYLCHWPLIFFARMIFGEQAETPVTKIVLLILMVIAAVLMRRFIEKPFRLLPTTRQTLGRFAILTAALVVVTHGTYLAKGWPQRLTAEQLAETDQMGFSFQPCQTVQGRRCAFGELDAPLGIELIGDSLAQQYVGTLDPILRARHMRGEISKYSSGCPVLVGLGLPKNNWNPRLCSRTMSDELQRVRTSRTHLIIAQNWSAYRDELYGEGGASHHYARVKQALEATIRDLGKNGRKILIMGAMVDAQQCKFDLTRLLPGPLPHARPRDCAPKMKSVAIREAAEINAVLNAVQQQWPDQISLILPVDVFCDEFCPAVKNGEWLYFNPGHFSVAGARYFGERAKDQLSQFLDD